MRTWGWTRSRALTLAWLVTLYGLAGCAPAAPHAGAGAMPVTVPDVAGTWVGPISPVSGTLTAGGGGPGQLRVVLTQQGSGVRGSFDMPGVRGAIQGRLFGATFTGGVEGQAGQGAGNLPLEFEARGDELVGRLEHTPIRLRRVR